jgi:hypothetical protein
MLNFDPFDFPPVVMLGLMVVVFLLSIAWSAGAAAWAWIVRRVK